MEKRREFGSRIFSALANPARLHVLECVANGPASVKQIAEAVGLKQSTTSQHLSALLRAGIVVSRTEGNLHIYTLRGPRIARILSLVEEFYEIHLDSLRELLDRYT